MQTDYQEYSLGEDFNQTRWEQSMREHRLLMRKCGLVLRDLGPAAMFAFSACLSVQLIFFLGDYLTNGRLMRRYRADKFVMFYSNPSQAEEKLIEAFDQHVNLMILLNHKKRLAIVHDLRQRILPWAQTKLLIADLDGQQAQLRLLLGDKSSVWPANRVASWRHEQRRFLVGIYMLILATGYIASIVIVFATSWLINERMIAAGETPFYFMERIGFTEIFLVVYYGFEKYIDPMIVLVANLRDKKLFLLTIQSRFKALRAKLIQLRLVNETTDDTDDYNCGDQLLEGQSIQTNRRLELRSECDKEALRIYLSLRVFFDELKPSTGLVGIIVKQYCLMALIMMSLTLPWVTFFDTTQLLVLGVLLFDLISVINVAFVLCARFESGCIQTTRLIWSLVASLSREPLGDEKFLSQPIARLNLRLNIGEKFAFNSPRNSLINEHTAVLWRRFLADMPGMHENFHCKIFGAVRLNYGGMLQLNFWLISVIIAFFNHQR